MGVSIYLNWKENGENKWEYVFKLSSYPYDLQDYNIPDEKLPSKLDSKYIQDYLEWLKKLQFLMKFAPDKYMEYNHTSNNIKTLLECINEDISNTLKVIRKIEELNRNSTKNWISVG